MSEAVVIKSNRYGIHLLLNPDIPFDELLVQIAEKFKKAEKFFRGGKVGISFGNRILTDEQQLCIVETITGTIPLRILCIMEQGSDEELRCRKLIESLGMDAAPPPTPVQSAAYYGEECAEAAAYDGEAGDEEQEEAAAGTFTDSDLQECLTNIGQFYRGTLRNGQLIESEASVIVIGDVNPGAKIVAGGDIIVFGALKGTAYAGIYGNESAFVAALEMDPIQIRIGDVIARSADGSAWKGVPKNRRRRPEVKLSPQAAVVVDGHISIENITKEFLNSL